MAIINASLRNIGRVNVRGHSGKILFKMAFSVVSDSKEEIDYISGVLQETVEKAVRRKNVLKEEENKP